MRYKRIVTKLRKGDVDILDILFNSMDLLEQLAVVAVRADNPDPELILAIYDRLLEANDRFTSIILRLEASEDDKDKDDKPKQQLGFDIAQSPPSGRVLEKDN